jgi:hypothetical protein
MYESVFCILLTLQDEDVNGDYLLLLYRTWFRGFNKKAVLICKHWIRNKMKITVSFSKAVPFRSTKGKITPGASTHDVKRL